MLRGVRRFDFEFDELLLLLFSLFILSISQFVLVWISFLWTFEKKQTKQLISFIIFALLSLAVASVFVVFFSFFSSSFFVNYIFMVLYLLYRPCAYIYKSLLVLDTKSICFIFYIWKRKQQNKHKRKPQVEMK